MKMIYISIIEHEVNMHNDDRGVISETA